MRTRATLCVIAGALVAPACANDTATSDGWARSTAPIITPAADTDPPAPFDVAAVASTSFGYRLAGSIFGGLVVWRSSDLSEFEPMAAPPCDCQLWVNSIVEFGSTLLVAASGTEGTQRAERGFVFRSDDGGFTWTSIDDPLFTADANRVDQILVGSDTVLAVAVDDRGDSGPRSEAAWSTDLVTWNRVVLPGVRDDEWPGFVASGDSVFAAASRSDDPEGRTTEIAFWSSTDGGRTFAAEDSIDDVNVGDLVVHGDLLVRVPDSVNSDEVHQDPIGISLLRPGERWETLAPDTGTWGDGSSRLSATGTTGTPSGRSYGVVRRTDRARVHYCFDDPTTCQQPSTALIATDDGRSWLDVVDVDPPDQRSRQFVLVSPDGDIVVLALAPGAREIRVTRWVGEAAPRLTARPDPAPPSIPVALYDPLVPLQIGDERRYALPLGGCGGMRIGDGAWEPDEAIPDPPPDAWPHRFENAVDGPTGFVYGRIRRVADDAIEFSIEGRGVVAVFRPAASPDFGCG